MNDQKSIAEKQLVLNKTRISLQYLESNIQATKTVILLTDFIKWFYIRGGLMVAANFRLILYPWDEMLCIKVEKYKILKL